MNKKRGAFILVGFIAAVFCIGYLGWVRYYRNTGETVNPSRLVYITLQLFFLESGNPDSVHIPVFLNIARFLAPVAAFGSAVIALAYRFRKRLQKAALRLFGKDHIIFFGVNRLSFDLIEKYRGAGKTVVAVDDTANPFLRECAAAGAVTENGRVPGRGLLRRCAFHRAESIFLFHEDDAVNYEGATRIYENLLLRSRQRRYVKCYLRCSNGSFKQLFLHHDLFTDPSDFLEVFFVDMNMLTARLLLHTNPPDYQRISPESEKRVHIALVGFTGVAECILEHALRICRFANERKPAVTVFDPAADSAEKRLSAKKPEINELCDCRFIQTDIEGYEVIEEIGGIKKKPNELLSVYICIDNDMTALSVGINIRKCLVYTSFPLCIRVLRNYSIPKLISSISTTAVLFDNVQFFGSLEETASIDMIEGRRTDTLARTIHEKYRAELKKESPADVGWHYLDETLKDSNRAQADHIPVKLRAVGIPWKEAVEDAKSGHLDRMLETHVELLGRMEHNRWIAERLLNGWRYGPVRDDKRKLHPHLVSWDELPEYIKEYDRNAIRNIPDWIKLYTALAD